MQSKQIQKMTQLALMFALTVVLMFLEGLIPPIPTLPPGIKLGLSNVAATVVNLLGYEKPEAWDESVIELK